MKNLITILALVLGIGLANAQEKDIRQQRSPEEMAKMQTERLTKELKLTKPQQDSIHKYVLASSVEQQKLFKENVLKSDNPEANRKKMQAIREKQTQKVKSFLNEEQNKKYDEILKQRRQNIGKRNQAPKN